MEPEKDEKVCDWGYDGGGWPIPLCQPNDSGWCFKPEACDFWTYCPLCGGRINRTERVVP